MENKFKIGDVVVLKSGGCKMTVNKLTSEGVDCKWFDNEFNSKSNTFSMDSLTLITELPNSNVSLNQISEFIQKMWLETINDFNIKKEEIRDSLKNIIRDIESYNKDMDLFSKDAIKILHYEIIKRIKTLKLEDHFDFSEKENGTKEIKLK